MNTQCIVGSPEGKHFKNVSNLYIPPLKMLYFTCTNDFEYSETDRNYKWLLIVKENLKKKSYQFLKYARAYLC